MTATIADLNTLIDHTTCPHAEHAPSLDKCSNCGGRLIFCGVAAARNRVAEDPRNSYSGYHLTYIHADDLTRQEPC